MKRPFGILFICVANSARSQLAEGLAAARFGDSAFVQSAGSRPGRVRPEAIEALHAVGIQHASARAKSVDEIDAADVDLVVTLCAEEVCPVWPHPVVRLHWPMPDPAAGIEAASPEVRRLRFAAVRDAIEARIEAELVPLVAARA